MSSFRRALLSVTLVCAAVAPGTAATAATRMYVSTDRAADGTMTVSAYAFDGMTQITDTFQLDVVRGGAVVATDTQPGFVILPVTLEPGDDLVVTDTTTAGAPSTATYTGQPTLVPPACGAAAFSGTRADGSTLDVSAAGVATVQFFGAGTAFAGAFDGPLAAGVVVKAAQARAIDAAFTVFDAVSVEVGGACPVVEPPAPPITPTPAPPVPAPAPAVPAPAVVAPAPVADTLAPAGRVTLRARTPAAFYRSLLAGTFLTTVAVGEPASIVQTLTTGRTVLGTATVRAARAGTSTVRLKLSKNGRRRLARARTTRLTLKTVLRDAAGNARTLPVRRFVARR